MNLSGPEVNAQYLIVSQFTLYGNVKGQNRPSFIRAAPKPKAIECYDQFVTLARKHIGDQWVRHSAFGLYLAVELVNDGPVTLWLDSHELF